VFDRRHTVLCSHSIEHPTREATVPLVRIDARSDKTPETLRAISDGVHRALVEAIGIPEDDRFQILTTHPAHELVFDEHYMGVERRDVVFVQITLLRGRTEEKKQDLYRRIVKNLHADAGVRPQDVLVTLTENDRVDWSVGEGAAQLVAGKG
jgi:phenylpyruvate tautomerase PptA (4-oxalocrotonate tautomerase family)